MTPPLNSILGPIFFSQSTTADPDVLIFSDYPTPPPNSILGPIFFSQSTTADPDVLIFSDGPTPTTADPDVLIFSDGPTPTTADPDVLIFSDGPTPTTADPDVLIFSDGPTPTTADPDVLIFSDGPTPTTADPDVLIFSDGTSPSPPVETTTVFDILATASVTADPDVLIFSDGTTTANPGNIIVPCELSTASPPNPDSIVFPAPRLSSSFFNGRRFQTIFAGKLEVRITEGYYARLARFVSGLAQRVRRSLPQAMQDENTQYKKVMIGQDLYRRFSVAHTVMDYQETIFTDNVNPMAIKHFLTMMDDGREYHKYSVGETQTEEEGVFLPDDQQPKAICPKCPQCACEKCVDCAQCSCKCPELDTTTVLTETSTLSTNTETTTNTTTPITTTTSTTINSTTTTPKTTTIKDKVAPEANNTTPKDNEDPEDNTVTPIPCDEPESMPKNRKHLKNNGRPNTKRQPSPVRGESPRSRPRGTKYLKLPMAPIDC